MGAEGVVIVGAGPAGLATARAYREHGGSAPVTMIGEESRLPYERPPLTKELMRGALEESELLLEQQSWFEVNQIELVLGAKVQAIDRQRRTVSIEGKGVLEAEAIVLATGSEPLRPQLPGLDHPSVLTMRMLPDSRAITACADWADDVVVVIGTGFVGCEIAASLAMRGARVKLIGQDEVPQEARLGLDAGRRIAGWLAELGVELVGGAEVSAVHEAQTVELDDGRRIDGSCVVLGMGARPRGELAEAAGLQLRDGAVVVDEAMRAPGERAVLAVGDVAHAMNVAAGRSLRVEHWGDALEHGAIAGCSLAGGDARWDGVPGFWSTIGEQTLKHAAWGDGYEESRTVEHAHGGFTVWYSRGGAAVGVLTHDCDEDYERGSELIRAGEPAP